MRGHRRQKAWRRLLLSKASLSSRTENHFCAGK
jgi:hypothetical protein